MERSADVVPGAKHGGMAALVIQPLECSIEMLLLVASCVDRSLLVVLVRDYSAYNFDSYELHTRVFIDENKKCHFCLIAYWPGLYTK